MRAIGLNHALETALADIVDNSIDAGASRVLIRFMRNGTRLLGIDIVDDGIGMDDEAIDKAMTIGGTKNYEIGDLGHFGLGLKAASLGQAGSLTVISRSGGKAVGRRWLLAKASEGFECDRVDADFADSQLDRDWQFVTPSTGTLVRWAEVKSFPVSTKSSVVEGYLEGAVQRVRQHLGIVFHRLIESSRIELSVDVQDLDSGESGPLFLIEPINPFGYLRSGKGGYPKTVTTQWRDHQLSLVCHIWPGRSQLPNFRLPGGRPEEFQGFFFYRNQRLLQRGGWNGLVNPERNLQLARVAIDIDESLDELFSMNPEKTQVQAGSGFGDAVETAKLGRGLTFDRFLEDARTVFHESRKRKRERAKVVPPGRGFAPRVRKAIARELEPIPGEDPVDIRWEDLAEDVFFEVDRDEHVIWINKRFRWAVLGDRDASLNDAPLVKALLYLLAEDLFHGAYLGAKDKDNIELWQSILTSAAEAELE
jgi:hypothetical protein